MSGDDVAEAGRVLAGKVGGYLRNAERDTPPYLFGLHDTGRRVRVVRPVPA